MSPVPAHGTTMIPDTVVAGDCIQVLPTLPPASVELLFNGPPFNIGHGYDVYRDRLPKNEYLTWADRWLAAALRVLKPHGSL